MITIQEKYQRDRHLIEDGDLMLFRGTGLVAKIIQNSDKNADGSRADFSHIGIVIKKNGALFIVDANANGIQADRLSYRVNGYGKTSNFTIIRPICSTRDLDVQMTKLLHKSDDEWIKYDFKNGIKELANRRFGWKLPIYLNDKKDICSDYVSRFAVNLDMVNQDFKDKIIVFPADYIRHRNTKYTAIIC